MSERLLEYMNNCWQGENKDYVVMLSDATMRKHFQAYMESQGLRALTYLELQEEFKRLADQQFQEFQRFRRQDYWLACGDQEVRRVPRTREAWLRLHGREGQ
jgi:hypothetical protein